MEQESSVYGVLRLFRPSQFQQVEDSGGIALIMEEIWKKYDTSILE